MPSTSPPQMAVRALAKLQPLAVLVVGPHLWPRRASASARKAFIFGPLSQCTMHFYSLERLVLT